MRVELTEDPAGFRTAGWSELASLDPSGTFFHTPAYLKLWWEEFGTGSLAIALAVEGDDVVGACCFEVVAGADEDSGVDDQDTFGGSDAIAPVPGIGT